MDTARLVEQPDPVFLVGHFRTGSTMLWSLFRTASDRYRAYGEPFHEHLLPMVDNKGLVPNDPTHQDVDDVFAEFRDLDREALGHAVATLYSRERFLLEQDDEAPDMEAYLRFLIDSSPQRPILKFTRATFRVEWLRRRFPGATIIQLVRRPRDIWTSMWGRGRDLEGEPFGSFLAYTELMAQDIGLDLPGDSYRTFYAVMLLADELSEKVADDRLVYEEAVGDFTAWGTRHLVGTGLMEAIPPITMRVDSIGAEGHGDDWYDAQEEAVRSLVGDSVKRFLLGSDREGRES